MKLRGASYINNIFCQTTTDQERYLNPADIYLPKGYKIEVYITGLNFPVNMVFTEYGEIGDIFMADYQRITRINCQVDIRVNIIYIESCDKTQTRLCRGRYKEIYSER